LVHAPLRPRGSGHRHCLYGEPALPAPRRRDAHRQGCRGGDPPHLQQDRRGDARRGSRGLRRLRGRRRRMDPRHPQGLIRARHRKGLKRRQGLKRRRAPRTGESDSRTTGVRHRGRAGRTPTPGGSPMADIYAAQLSPSKVEVVTEWVTGQDWAADFDLAAAPLEPVTSYRFDDPAGEVGLEVHILRSGDRHIQVPLTYRGTPLDGADEHLISTMDHSVVGRRWVYAGMGDPLVRPRLDDSIATAGTAARQFRVDDEGRRIEEITEVANAFGTGPLAGAGDVEM